VTPLREVYREINKLWRRRAKRSVPHFRRRMGVDLRAGWGAAGSRCSPRRVAIFSQTLAAEGFHERPPFFANPIGVGGSRLLQPLLWLWFRVEEIGERADALARWKWEPAAMAGIAHPACALLCWRRYLLAPLRLAPAWMAYFPRRRRLARVVTSFFPARRGRASMLAHRCDALAPGARRQGHRTREIAEEGARGNAWHWFAFFRPASRWRCPLYGRTMRFFGDMPGGCDA